MSRVVRLKLLSPHQSSQHISPAKGDRSQFSQFGFGVKKMLTDYWSVSDSKGKDYSYSNELKRSDSFSSTAQEVSATASVGSSECSREIVSPLTHDSPGEQ